MYNHYHYKPVISPTRSKRRQNGRRFKEENEPSFTLTRTDIGAVFSEQTEILRRLTEIECERLQGFPDDWTKYGIYKTKKGTVVKEVPSTYRYQMLGNAVTTTLVKIIVTKLKNKYEY